jgi:hypothetical protein
LCFAKEHGCEDGVGVKTVEKRWRCVFVEERGNEGGIGKT